MAKKKTKKEQNSKLLSILVIVLIIGVSVLILNESNLQNTNSSSEQSFWGSIKNIVGEGKRTRSCRKRCDGDLLIIECKKKGKWETTRTVNCADNNKYCLQKGKKKAVCKKRKPGEPQTYAHLTTGITINMPSGWKAEKEQWDDILMTNTFRLVSKDGVIIFTKVNKDIYSLIDQLTNTLEEEAIPYTKEDGTLNDVAYTNFVSNHIDEEQKETVVDGYYLDKQGTYYTIVLLSEKEQYTKNKLIFTSIMESLQLE